MKKLTLIIFVMLCAYLTLTTIIHYSKGLAKTDSEATTYPVVPTEKQQ